MVDQKNRDDVTVENAGRVVTAWTSVSVSRGIDRAAGSFTLTFPRTAAQRRSPDGGHVLTPIVPGVDGVRIRLGGDAVLWGFVDAVRPGTDQDAGAVQVLGRSKTADLVDCSAMNEPGQWQNTTLGDVVRAIAKPFGIAVDVQADQAVAVTSYELNPGEKAFDAIERLCRRHGYLVHDDGDGALVIARPLGVKSKGALQYVYGKDGAPDPSNNVLKTSARISFDNRYSDIVVRGQNAGTDTAFGTAASRIEGRAKDVGVKRYRPLIVNAAGRVDSASARAQAEWEVARRIGQGIELTHVVRGWRQSLDGPLWQPGLVVPVRDASSDIFDDMLVVEVEWTFDDRNGRLARLTLQPPEAVKPKPYNDALKPWSHVRDQVSGKG